MAQEAAPSASSDVGQKIVEIRVIGSRRIPRETILARMFSHVNDPYDPLTVERDFNSLWNTGYFEDVRIEKEDTPQGVILDVYVREKPTIRDITYKGLSSVTESDVLDRFKKEKVGLSQESQYDPARIAKAVTVIKEMLAEHGHQFATVRPEVRTIPPASVQLIFLIKEGPTVKVGKITFSGNRHVNSRTLREAMRNLRPIGIPHSILLENLFARTYDATKLDEDTERVRQAYRDRGYLRGGPVGPAETKIRNESGLSLFTFRPRKGKRIDIHMNIEEGERYRLASINFTGYKPGTNVKALRSVFTQKDGSIFDLTTFQKDLENLRKAYSQNGYINFSPLPVPTFDDAKHTVTWNIDIDEGKQFTVSRIEFQGNTVTRDFVIRRELLLQEGQVYNSHLWELSLLRLNQLDYFNPLRVDQDSETHQNTEAGTVDLLLKVQEKGKNSIGLNGGVSGLSGAFLGLNYQTNNFLGLGETLSVQANAGSLARNLLFAFNEPYFRNKPLNIGFQVFDRKTDYNASKSYSLSGSATGNESSAISSLLQNYNQGEKGFNLSVSYPTPPLQPLRLLARRRHLCLGQLFGPRLQPGLQQSLPDPRLPQRHSGAERAGRHHHQLGDVQLQLQQRLQQLPAPHRPVAVGHRAVRRHLGQRSLYPPGRRIQALPAHERPLVQPEWPQHPGHAPAGDLHYRIQRRCRPALRSPLSRR